MQIDTEKLDMLSAMELAEIKKAIDAELQKHLEHLTGVLGIPTPKKRGRRVKNERA